MLSRLPRRPLALVVPVLLTVLVLAGCATKPFDPLAEVSPSGKRVELNISVEDLYETPLYPGLKANLWAFCVSAVDPNDAYSVAAIHYWDQVPGEDSKGTTSWGAEKTSPRPECSVPAPTIVVGQGDRVVVHFSHTHPHVHTIHWHGQYVPADMDGAPGVSQTGVGPGGLADFTYDFIAKRQGTLWYHCHVDTQMHQMQGLYGMFIVKPQDTSHEPKVDREAYMVLSTMTRAVVEAVPGITPHSHPLGATSGNIGYQNPPQFLEPDVFLINGHSYPLSEKQNQTMYHIGKGEKLRLRILNAGLTLETVHIHGHDMEVTHRDGLPLDSPFWVDTLSIGPGERYDAVITGNNPGAWMVHTHVNDHETNDHQSPGGMHTMLVYHGYEDQCAECKAELTAGFPYQKPVIMPADFENSTILALNPKPSVPPSASNANVHATWKFPVELPCAVQSITLDGFLEGGGAFGVALTSLDVRVQDPNGTDKGGFHLGRDGAPSGELRINGSAPGSPYPQTVKGEYTVDIAGTAVQSSVHLHVKVDYPTSFDEMKRAHQLDKYSSPLLCGKYGNGTEGVAAGPAP